MGEKEPLIIRILKKLHIIKTKELSEEEQIQAKREMCRRAVQSNICPHVCSMCAWNVELYKDMEFQDD